MQLIDACKRRTTMSNIRESNNCVTTIKTLQQEINERDLTNFYNGRNKVICRKILELLFPTNGLQPKSFVHCPHVRTQPKTRGFYILTFCKF